MQSSNGFRDALMKLFHLNLTLSISLTYFILGYFGQILAIEPGLVTPVWPPSGFALAMVILYGRKSWYGILIGAFLINTQALIDAFSIEIFINKISAGVFIALGSLLQPLLGSYLIKKLIKNNDILVTNSNFLAFVLIIPLVCIVSSTIGTSSLFFTNTLGIELFQTVWLTWWLGDSIGVLLFTPLILLLFKDIARLENVYEFYLLLTIVVLVTLFGFGLFFNLDGTKYPLAFLSLPFLLLIALRTEVFYTVVSSIIVFFISVLLTYNGYGPFYTTNTNISLLLLQSFILINFVTTILFSILITTQQQTEKSLRSLQLSLEEQVKDRTAELEKSNKTAKQLAEDLTLMIKELHHRVKNNFQVILTFLWAQKKSIKEEDSLAALEQTMQRIYAISSLHELLNISDTVSVNIKSYMEGIISTFNIQNSKVQYKYNIENSMFAYDQAVSLGLILNELITNSKKHAFESIGEPVITISFYRKEEKYIFDYSDNGVGFNVEKIQKNSGLGYDLIYGFIAKHDATVTLNSNAGMQIQIIFNEEKDNGK